MREIPALREGCDKFIHDDIAGRVARVYDIDRSGDAQPMELTMRWLAAALILFAGVSAASADIRIDHSRYADGRLYVSGNTAPNRTVTLDRKFTTKSDAEGHFKFSVKNYKPPICMSDIRSGGDVYSAVIAGCFGAAAAAQPAVSHK
jgi:hypothetical protein